MNLRKRVERIENRALTAWINRLSGNLQSVPDAGLMQLVELTARLHDEAVRRKLLKPRAVEAALFTIGEMMREHGGTFAECKEYYLKEIYPEHQPFAAQIVEQ